MDGPHPLSGPCGTGRRGGSRMGLPHVDSIVLTINAVGTFIGALIGASHVKAAHDA